VQEAFPAVLASAHGASRPSKASDIVRVSYRYDGQPLPGGITKGQLVNPWSSLALKRAIERCRLLESASASAIFC
jgi:hypothetical protein